jgi:hypothetical protein
MPACPSSGHHIIIQHACLGSPSAQGACDHWSLSAVYCGALQHGNLVLLDHVKRSGVSTDACPAPSAQVPGAHPDGAGPDSEGCGPVAGGPGAGQGCRAGGGGCAGQQRQGACRAGVTEEGGRSWLLHACRATSWVHMHVQWALRPGAGWHVVQHSDKRHAACMALLACLVLTPAPGPGPATERGGRAARGGQA